jgi:hypothetical protein
MHRLAPAGVTSLERNLENFNIHGNGFEREIAVARKN